MEKAVKAVFKFGKKVLEKWPDWRQCLARSATACVGLVHVLHLGGASVARHVASAVQPVPVEGRVTAKKEALTADPASSTALLDFYSGAVLERVAHARGKNKPAAAPSGPVVGITFSPSPRADPQLAKNVRKLVRQLLNFDVQQEDAQWHLGAL